MSKNKTPKIFISGVYIIENVTKHIFYVGSSQNLEQRRKEHFAALKNGKHINKTMQKDYNEGDYFIFGVYKFVYPDHKQLFYEERLITEEIGKTKDLYNIELLTNVRLTSTEALKNRLVDYLCRKRLGRSFDQMCVGMTPAGYDMYFDIITSDPEEEKAIRAKYQPLIDYQNKEKYEKYFRGKQKIS